MYLSQEEDLSLIKILTEEGTAAEEFYKNSKAIWLFWLGFFNSSIRIQEEFSDPMKNNG